MTRSGKLYTCDDLHKLFAVELYYLPTVHDWQVEAAASDLLAKYLALLPGYIEGKHYEIAQYIRERDQIADDMLAAARAARIK